VTYGRLYAPVDPPVRPFLLEIALINKDPDEVLEWYIPCAHRMIIGHGQDPDDRVADVIAIQYPEKAIEIWKTLAEKIIVMKNPDRYYDAVMILMKVRDASTKTRQSGEFSEHILHRNNGGKKLVSVFQNFSTGEEGIKFIPLHPGLFHNREKGSDGNRITFRNDYQEFITIIILVKCNMAIFPLEGSILESNRFKNF